VRDEKNRRQGRVCASYLPAWKPSGPLVRLVRSLPVSRVPLPSLFRPPAVPRSVPREVCARPWSSVEQVAAPRRGNGSAVRCLRVCRGCDVRVRARDWGGPSVPAWGPGRAHPPPPPRMSTSAWSRPGARGSSSVCARGHMPMNRRSIFWFELHTFSCGTPTTSHSYLAPGFAAYSLGNPMSHGPDALSVCPGRDSLPA